jgi:hypothetical protein
MEIEAAKICKSKITQKSWLFWDTWRMNGVGNPDFLNRKALEPS